MKKFNNLIKIFMIIIIFCIIITINMFHKKISIIDEYKKKDVYLILKVKDGDYWNTIKIGAETAAKEFNINLIFIAPDDEEDVAGQIRLVKSAIKNSADAIVLAASDYEELTDVIQIAQLKGIPVIAIDSEVDTKRYKSFIGTDNFEAGRKAALKLIDIAGKNCNVAIISFIKGAGNGDMRESGFLNEVAKHPNIRVVAKEYGLSDVTLSAALTRKVLKEVSRVDAVVALNTISSIGVAKAVEQMDLKGKIKVITFDSTQKEIEYLEKGTIQATVVQNPFSMGYLGIKYAYDSLNGERIPRRVDTGSKVIDIENMYNPENQKIIFSFIK